MSEVPFQINKPETTRLFTVSAGEPVVIEVFNMPAGAKITFEKEHWTGGSSGSRSGCCFVPGAKSKKVASRPYKICDCAPELSANSPIIYIDEPGIFSATVTPASAAGQFYSTIGVATGKDITDAMRGCCAATGSGGGNPGTLVEVGKVDAATISNGPGVPATPVPISIDANGAKTLLFPPYPSPAPSPDFALTVKDHTGADITSRVVVPGGAQGHGPTLILDDPCPPSAAPAVALCPSDEIVGCGGKLYKLPDSPVNSFNQAMLANTINYGDLGSSGGPPPSRTLLVAVDSDDMVSTPGNFDDRVALTSRLNELPNPWLSPPSINAVQPGDRIYIVINTAEAGNGTAYWQNTSNVINPNLIGSATFAAPPALLGQTGFFGFDGTNPQSNFNYGNVYTAVATGAGNFTIEVPWTPLYAGAKLNGISALAIIERSSNGQTSVVDRFSSYDPFGLITTAPSSQTANFSLPGGALIASADTAIWFAASRHLDAQGITGLPPTLVNQPGQDGGTCFLTVSAWESANPNQTATHNANAGTATVLRQPTVFWSVETHLPYDAGGGGATWESNQVALNLTNANTCNITEAPRYLLAGGTWEIENVPAGASGEITLSVNGEIFTIEFSNTTGSPKTLKGVYPSVQGILASIAPGQASVPVPVTTSISFNGSVAGTTGAIKLNPGKLIITGLLQ